MKQITLISGKGGTGKTTLTAACASLADNAVIADCDVDAADLHLLLTPDIKKTESFSGMKLAKKDSERCTSCGRCARACRFGAFDADYAVIAERCEGCGVCAYVCPEKAITLVNRTSGVIYTSETRAGPMIHAQLNTAEEASGKLVTAVRTAALERAQRDGRDLVIIDGPPGTGCPVIAAISGVDLVTIVTEPTLSGLHDLERVIAVAHHFEIPAAVVINKADINPDNARTIEHYCAEHDIPVFGMILYDNTATAAMIAGKTITEYGAGPLAEAAEAVWHKMQKYIRPEGIAH